MIQVIFQFRLIKLFESINSAQAFYLSKVSWKIRSFFRFNPCQNLTWNTSAETLHNLFNVFKKKDPINHDLLIAKFHAYGFDKSSLKLPFSYLNNRWHRAKINQNFSSWEELFEGVPQWSVFVPLLFNIYLKDLLYLTESIEGLTLQMMPHFLPVTKI